MSGVPEENISPDVQSPPVPGYAQSEQWDFDPRLPQDSNVPVIGRSHPSRRVTKVVVITLLSFATVLVISSLLLSSAFFSGISRIDVVVIIAAVLVGGVVTAVGSRQTSTGWFLVFVLSGAFYTTEYLGNYLVFVLFMLGLAIAFIDYSQFRPCSGQRAHKPLPVVVLMGLLFTLLIGMFESLLAIVSFLLTFGRVPLLGAEKYLILVPIFAGICATAVLIMMLIRKSKPVSAVAAAILLTVMGLGVGFSAVGYLVVVVNSVFPGAYFSLFSSDTIAWPLNYLFFSILAVVLAWLPATRRWFAS